MDAFLSFLLYFVTAIVLLLVFMFIYAKVTPYNELKEIKENNVAAAITFGGAILGFTFPIVSSTFFTHDLLEMVLWSVVTAIVQLIVFLVLRRFAPDIKDGHVAPAILLASLSISVGLLNAVCISY